MKRRVYLAQVQNRYGDNAYLPYSVGLLWAYASQFDSVLDQWELGGFLYQKEPIERSLTRLNEPGLLGLSCYVWNWEWNLSFAQAVKRRWPDCMVLVGGPHVPEGSASTLERYPFIDFAIYGEGEGAFADLLVRNNVLASIGSLVYRDGYDKVVVTKRRAQVPVEMLRSPYLEGTFNDILGELPRWQVMQETNRGCPYHCTFCAWGTGSQDKVRKLPLEHVLSELEWASDHDADYIENCDANFGILPRDEEIVEKMVQLKVADGFPQRFRCAWAKNTTDRVFSMAKRLHEADMLKAVTLSVQSMHEETLVLAKRKNVKYEKLSDFVELYGAAGIPTYTELILGLPGESFVSFINGIDRLLDAGQHDGLFVYPCMILPNTELADPDYQKRHGIKTALVRAMLLHAIPDPNVVQEFQEVVIETSTMTHQFWRLGYAFAWVVQALHCCGLTQLIARELRKDGLDYSYFYLDLLRWGGRTIFEREFSKFARLLENSLVGGSWDLVDERFGPVSWPPEEHSFLQIACESDKFYDELGQRYPAWRELVEKQREAFIPPKPGEEAEYAREAVWYGRKGSGAKLRMRST